jgi:hypothetical protein
VLAFTKKRKSILLLFEKSFNDQRFNVTLELKTKEGDALLLEMPFSRNYYMNNDGVDNALKFAIATHDSKLIEHAIKLSKTSKIGIKNFEFELVKVLRLSIIKFL